MTHLQQIVLTENFDAGLVFASDLHRNQSRKQSPVPYMSHLLAVCALVLEDGGDEDEAIAALLHDSIEDAGAGYPGGRDALRAEIRNRFGERVLEIVNDCTDDEGHQKGTAGSAEEERVRWRERKREYLRHLWHTKNRPALRVSCADKLHNARTLLRDYYELGEPLWQRFRTRRGGDQIWVYSELARVFLERGVGRMALELNRVVAELIQVTGISPAAADGQSR